MISNAPHQYVINRDVFSCLKILMLHAGSRRSPRNELQYHLTTSYTLKVAKKGKVKKGKVRTSICIAHTMYYTPLMCSRHWTEPPGQSGTAHSLHTQAEHSGPTTGHGSQQQSGYYSFNRPRGMAGWAGRVGWLIADALPTKRSHGQPSV